jgi:hypothetical protein
MPLPSGGEGGGLTYASMFGNMREQVARTLREFGLESKGQARTFEKPYPDFFDTIPYLRGFRVPNFVKFTDEDSKTMYEHIGQFLAQVSDFGIIGIHKIKLFPLSLSSMTFNWFVITSKLDRHVREAGAEIP